MSEQKLVELAAKEILTERTQRYRRNVIGLGAVIIALTKLPFVNFSGMRLLGLELDPSFANPDYVVIGALWILMIYNCVIYGWFVFRDWRVWSYPVIASAQGGGSFSGFPQIKNYFGFPPDNIDTVVRAQNKNVDIKTILLHKDEDGSEYWKAKRFEKKEGYPDEETLCSVGGKSRKIVLQKIWQFGLLEVDVPAIITGVSIISTWNWYF